MFSRLVCAITGHLPSRSQAGSDGLHFHAPCKRCGRAMIRKASGWRLLDPARDRPPTPPLAPPPPSR